MNIINVLITLCGLTQAQAKSENPVFEDAEKAKCYAKVSTCFIAEEAEICIKKLFHKE